MVAIQRSPPCAAIISAKKPAEQVNDAADEQYVAPIKLAQTGFATPPTANKAGC